MKKVIIIAAAAVFSVFSVTAQNTESGNTEKKRNNDEIKTLFGPVNSHGGYFGLNMSVSELDDESTVYLGFRGGWVIGHGFAFGMAGGGFFNDYHYSEKLDQNVNLSGGYGGLFVEPILLAKFPVHVSLPVVMGVGGISYSGNAYYRDENEWGSNMIAEDAYLIVEPGIEIEMNLLKSIRFCVGASYRYTTALDLDQEYTGLSKDVMQGLTLGAAVKFGKF